LRITLLDEKQSIHARQFCQVSIRIKRKIKEWWNRYKYPEAFSIAAFLLFNLLLLDEGIDELHFSYLLTLTEYISYYLVVFYLFYRAWAALSERPSIRTLFAAMALEFGPAALVDFLFIRPFLIYSFSLWMDGGFLSIVLGSLSADLCFYTLTICCFEGWIKPSPTYDLIGQEFSVS
jgi:hypothetical protein